MCIQLSPCHCYVWISNLFQPIFFKSGDFLFRCSSVLIVFSFIFQCLKRIQYVYWWLFNDDWALLTYSTFTFVKPSVCICKCNLEWISDECLFWGTKRKFLELNKECRFGRSAVRGSRIEMCPWNGSIGVNSPHFTNPSRQNFIVVHSNSRTLPITIICKSVLQPSSFHSSFVSFSLSYVCSLD